MLLRTVCCHPCSLQYAYVALDNKTLWEEELPLAVIQSSECFALCMLLTNKSLSITELSSLVKSEQQGVSLSELCGNELVQVVMGMTGNSVLGLSGASSFLNIKFACRREGWLKSVRGPVSNVFQPSFPGAASPDYVSSELVFKVLLLVVDPKPNQAKDTRLSVFQTKDKSWSEVRILFLKTNQCQNLDTATQKS